MANRCIRCGQVEADEQVDYCQQCGRQLNLYKGELEEQKKASDIFGVPIARCIIYFFISIITGALAYQLDDSNARSVEAAVKMAAIKETITTEKQIISINSLTNWVAVGEEWQYLGLNGAVRGWQRLNGNMYFFDDDAMMAHGWLEAGGNWYYFAEDEEFLGIMQRGWIGEPGAYFYLDDDGTMVKGWREITGDWYYFSEADEDPGRMLTGWLAVDNQTYYLSQDGAMLTGQHKIEGNDYFFSNEGYLSTDKILTETDIMEASTEDITKVSEAEKYSLPAAEDNDSSIPAAIIKETTTAATIPSTTPAVETTPAPQVKANQWVQESKGWIYLDAQGNKVFDWKTIDGKSYFFGKDGIMKTGWQEIDGKWYYFDYSGIMAVGSRIIDGQKQEFNASGVWIEPVPEPVEVKKELNPLTAAIFENSYWFSSYGNRIAFIDLNKNGAKEIIFYNPNSHIATASIYRWNGQKLQEIGDISEYGDLHLYSQSGSLVFVVIEQDGAEENIIEISIGSSSLKIKYIFQCDEDSGDYEYLGESVSRSSYNQRRNSYFNSMTEIGLAGISVAISEQFVGSEKDLSSLEDQIMAMYLK